MATSPGRSRRRRGALLTRMQMIIGSLMAAGFAWLEVSGRVGQPSLIGAVPALALMMLFVFLHILLRRAAEPEEEPRGLTLASRTSRVTLDWGDLATPPEAPKRA